MFESIAAFHFLRPWWLLGLLPLLFTLRYLRRSDDIGRTWHQVIAPHLLAAMVVRRGGEHWINPARVAVVMMSLGFVVVAGPTWERQPTPLFEDEAPLIIALDVSDSMNQQDIQPSRLKRARQKIEDLLKLRGGSRAALLVFAGSAHTVIPLTNDPDILLHLLASVNTDMMPRPGKLPEKILPIVAGLQRDSMVPGTLLLLTDGVGQTTIETFTGYFSEKDARLPQLLVLGVGSVADRASGTPDVPLERAALRRLAAAGGGAYEEITADRSDVQRLARAIDNHLVGVQDNELPWVDAGYWLLIPFAFLFLLWFRRGWTLQWLVVFLGVTLLLPVPAHADFVDWWLTPDQQGRYFFEAGDYRRAAQRFEDSGWKAAAYYEAEEFDLAAEYFARDDRIESLFNRANALAHARRYVEAVQAFDLVLAREPAHEGAGLNRAIVQAIIDEINAMSEAQQSEGMETARELGDAPQTADGAQREVLEGEAPAQLTADEILADERVQEMWLRGVQADPAQFLSVKFQMQLERQAP